MLFPIFWVQQKVMLDENVATELVFARSIFDWGAIACAGGALLFATVAAIATCCPKKTFKKELAEKLDEELKLNLCSNLEYQQEKVREEQQKLNPM
jgi:hypothetical protein